MAVLDDVSQARQNLETSRQTLIARIFEREKARAFLSQVKRTGSAADVDAAQAALTTAEGNYSTALNDEGQKKTDLAGKIGDWLAGQDQEADLQRVSADNPIVLFPVRVETRFRLDPAGNKLLVRIYPDEIFVNVHERALTPEEKAAGEAYWTADIDHPTEQDRWRRLIASFPVKRAAYIARALTPTGDDGQPTDPGTGQRPAVWTRPGEAVLPDRWAVTLYPPGQPARTALGNPIREPLAVTLNPGATTADLTAPTADGLQIEKDLAWTTDFQSAVDAGMALEIPLQGSEAKFDSTGGFDRLIVLGVKTSMAPKDTAVLLEQLFDAQHYTNGLGFVRQGSPTNNTIERPVTNGPPDRTGDVSFAIERAQPPGPLDKPTNDATLAPNINFQLLAQAFGLPSGVFRNLRDADLREQVVAHAMNWILWPTTLGYFMDQLMDPVFGTGAVKDGHQKDARRYFVDRVLGRGNYPAFRVEEVPYGVLPVLSLDRWDIRDIESSDEPLESRMIATLLRLRQIWRRGEGVTNIAELVASLSSHVPPAPPESPLLLMLAHNASSRSMRVRSAQGLPTLINAIVKAALDPISVFIGSKSAASTLMADLGHPEWQPRVADLTFSDQTQVFRDPLVWSKTDDPATYLPELTTLSLDQLRDLDTTGKPLLYQLVRSALMNEYIRIAHAEVPGNATLGALRAERELWNVKSGVAGQTTIFQAFHESIGPSETIGSRVANSDDRSFYQTLVSIVAPLDRDELERLMTETLDISSHRLDAWISAFAARRLSFMRLDQPGDPLGRKGSLLGAYAFLQDLRPRQRTTRTTTDVGTVDVQPENGGFIHAPSLAHARAAAILRSGHLAHRREDPKKYAVNVSSERARRARELLDEVRNEVSVGAALGYRFERGVRETVLPPGVKVLGPYVQRLRELFPLVANQNSQTTDPALVVETLAGQNVVQGQQMLEAFNAVPMKIPFDTDARLPRRTTAEYGLLKQQLDSLNDLFDAVSDLLTAESTLQLVQGNATGAQAAADALVNGASPPEIDVTRSPRTGIAVTHRVALVFQGATPPTLPAHWRADATARALAEPFLDGWLGKLLGDPQRIVASVTYNVGNQDHSQEVDLSMLNIRPLDFLAVARTSKETTPGSSLDRRVLATLTVTGGSDFKVTYGGAPALKVSFTQALALARAAAALFPGARPLRATDLQTPTDAAANTPTDTTEFVARASNARTKLADAREALHVATTPGAQRDALITAAQYAGDLYPDKIPDATAVSAALDELDRRLARADEIAPAASATAPLTLDQATQVLGAVFGDDFVAIPAIGVPPASSELALSLAARATLLAGMSDAPAQLLQQTARVRDGLGRWRKLNLYAGALGASRPRLDVAQLPHVPGAKWAGGPLAGTPPDRGRLSLLMLSPPGGSPLDATQPWRGLLLDDWVEVIPSSVESTGLSFHYNGPNAEAGNAILIAVPGSAAANWSFAELLATAEETFDLVQLRAVDLDVLGLRQLLPGIYLPVNLDKAAPSSPMQGSFENDVRVVES